MSTLWTQEEINLIKEIYATTKPKDLESFFPGKKKNQIQLKANSIGIRLNDYRNLKRLLNGSIMSLYWMGFILADGWLTSQYSNKQKHTFGISLSEKDIEHIKILSEYINVPYHVYTRDTVNKSRFVYANITVNDNINVPLLKDIFSIENDKSHVPPVISNYNLTKDNLMALIIGYIDGDGSIVRRKDGRAMISIQCSYQWKDNLEFINSTISSFFNYETSNKVSINCRNHATLSISNQGLLRDLKRFAESKSLPIMSRKWDNIT